MSDGADKQSNTPTEQKAITPYVPSYAEIFLAFLKIGVSAFGGALPWARRVLVEEKHWIEDREFTDILTVCQAVPGPNVVNVSVFIGTRYHGVIGGAIAFLGIVGVPLCILLALNELYHSFAHVPQVKSAMKGMSIVATAYLVYMSLKTGKPFQRNVIAIALCITAALLSAFAQWHMALVLFVCGAAGVILSRYKKI
jgi:chromate transporter